MEKLPNHCDKEYMKMAMLKHEETFREQVYELHRLYQIQKILMKDIAKNPRNNNPHYGLETKQCLDLERPVEEFNYQKTSGKCKVISQIEDDQMHDLELTLGPTCYYHRKIKAAEPAAFQSDSGPSFSSSSTTGSSHIKRTTSRSVTREELLSQLSNQDRLNSPPWLFQALSLNMT
ncbi:hypothetical protein BUALT_Bualt04G0103300 [Buddleja alternifolia]|uniref:Uncharacterized protein n=1 Tax=Buddleja alternifolia TaxID=168488 RepID=A0AAV6XYN0_9LAMI|nr:hypothetical protein BUALT_Bualt04G0103300 [Buddleja alternifolia]